jgi:hypothetical protein
VLATAKEGTRSALTSAKRLTDGLNARVILLVPKIASLGRERDAFDDEPGALVAEHRAIAAGVGLDATVLCCVCQRAEDVVHRLLRHSSLVIVGGRQGMLWPTGEERLVRRLTSHGYAAVFAPIRLKPGPAAEEPLIAA